MWQDNVGFETSFWYFNVKKFDECGAFLLVSNRNDIERSLRALHFNFFPILPKVTLHFATASILLM